MNSASRSRFPSIVMGCSARVHPSINPVENRLGQVLPPGCQSKSDIQSSKWRSSEHEEKDKAEVTAWIERVAQGTVAKPESLKVRPYRTE